MNQRPFHLFSKSMQSNRVVFYFFPMFFITNDVLRWSKFILKPRYKNTDFNLFYLFSVFASHECDLCEYSETHHRSQDNNVVSIFCLINLELSSNSFELDSQFRGHRIQRYRHGMWMMSKTDPPGAFHLESIYNRNFCFSYCNRWPRNH